MSGDLDRATATLSAFVERHPEAAIARLNLAIALRNAQRFEEAKEQLDALMDLPELASDLLARANAVMRTMPGQGL